jgi:hypothetical protein
LSHFPSVSDSSRVLLAHFGYGFFSMLPKVAQQRANDLLAQLVTRASLSSGRIAFFTFSRLFQLRLQRGASRDTL